MCTLKIRITFYHVTLYFTMICLSLVLGMVSVNQIIALDIKVSSWSLYWFVSNILIPSSDFQSVSCGVVSTCVSLLSPLYTHLSYLYKLFPGLVLKWLVHVSDAVYSPLCVPIPENSFHYCYCRLFFYFFRYFGLFSSHSWCELFVITLI